MPVVYIRNPSILSMIFVSRSLPGPCKLVYGNGKNHNTNHLLFITHNVELGISKSSVNKSGFLENGTIVRK